MNAQVINIIFEALKEITNHLGLIQDVISEIRKDPDEIDTDKVIELLESIKPKEIKSDI